MLRADLLRGARTINKVRKLADIARHWPYVTALVQRVAAGVEHQTVLRQLDCKTIVDIGAHRGQFALVARRCFPQARIFSFEPLIEPAIRFKRVFWEDGDVNLHQVAIGPERRRAAIHVSRRDDSSSLLPITALQSRVFPGTQEQGTIPVDVAPLSAFLSVQQIDPIGLLKLDVQGYELEALKGCEDLLGRFRYVYAECSFVELYGGQALADEVVSWLRDRGFILKGTYNPCYDRSGKAVQADFLFASELSAS